MTVEYVLVLIAVFFIGLKLFISAPTTAFNDSGPHMGLRVERQLLTGDGFELSQNKKLAWYPPPQ